jgi:hypothetical protein
VLEAAVIKVAVAFEVESPAVIGGKTKEVKGPGGGGVGGGKPASKRVILTGRRDPRPESPKVGMKLGVGPCFSEPGGGAGAVGTAASRGTAAPGCTASAPAGAIVVACDGVALVCGIRGGWGWQGGALAEVRGEEALGNGEGGAEAFVNDAGHGRGLVGACEVAP